VRSTSRTLLAAPQASRYSRAKPHIPTNISRAVAQRSFPCPQPLSSSLFSRPAFLKVSSKEIHTRSMSRAAMVRASGEVIMDMEALQGISIFTADGESVQFTDLWDQKNVSSILFFTKPHNCSTNVSLCMNQFPCCVRKGRDCNLLTRLIARYL
jgi:hypothetical protein